MEVLHQAVARGDDRGRRERVEPEWRPGARASVIRADKEERERLRHQGERKERERGGSETSIGPVKAAGAEDHAHHLRAQDDEEYNGGQSPEDDVLSRIDHLAQKFIRIAVAEEARECGESGEGITNANNRERHGLEIESEAEDGDRASGQERSERDEEELGQLVGRQSERAREREQDHALNRWPAQAESEARP